MMFLSNQRFLILNNNNTGFFMDQEQGQKKLITFKFDKFQAKHGGDKGQIVSILMHEIYVIVVFETQIAIFNATTGTLLEERGFLDRFKYKGACLNT